MSRSDQRKRTRLVDRPFQAGMAWRMMFTYMVFFAGGLLILFAPSMYALATGMEFGELESASSEFLILHHRVWPSALFVFGGVFFYTLLFSSRIAGPLYRINATLSKMLEGEYPDKVVLRRGDYFQGTARLLETLSRKLGAEAGKSGGATVGKGNVEG